MDASELDALFRGVAIGAVIALAIAFWRGGAGHPVRITGVLIAVVVAAFALNSSELPRILPVQLISIGGAGLFWLFVVTLFEDRPISPSALAPWALLTLLGLAFLAASGPARSAVWFIHSLIQASVVAHALFIVVRSSRGDLVEARRRLRGPFLGIATLFVLLLTTVELSQSLGLQAGWHDVARSGAMLAAFCVAAAAVFLIARSELLGAATPPSTQDQLAPADRQALDRLRVAMEAGEAWRREGLTIGALATEVGVPEHRLRRLINDHLGHRNFAAYVNAYRIEAAKRRLCDPREARRSVSAIAFDLGFGSLGPFNRAFKDATGQTPSEWRRQASPIPETPG